MGNRIFFNDSYSDKVHAFLRNVKIHNLTQDLAKAVPASVVKKGRVKNTKLAAGTPSSECCPIPLGQLGYLFPLSTSHSPPVNSGVLVNC